MPMGKGMPSAPIPPRPDLTSKVIRKDELPSDGPLPSRATRQADNNAPPAAKADDGMSLLRKATAMQFLGPIGWFFP